MTFRSELNVDCGAFVHARYKSRERRKEGSFKRSSDIGRGLRIFSRSSGVRPESSNFAVLSNSINLSPVWMSSIMDVVGISDTSDGGRSPGPAAFVCSLGGSGTRGGLDG